MPIIGEEIFYRGYSFSIPGDACQRFSTLRLCAVIRRILREQPNQPIWMEELPSPLPPQGYPIMIIGNPRVSFTQLGSIKDEILSSLQQQEDDTIQRGDTGLEEEFFSRRTYAE